MTSAVMAKYIVRASGWRIVEDYLTSDEEVVSTSFLLLGVALELKRMVENKIISSNKALQTYYDFLDAIRTGLIVLIDPLPYLKKAFQIAIDRGLDIIEATNLALALDKKAHIMVSDGRLLSEAKREGLKVIKV